MVYFGKCMKDGDEYDVGTPSSNLEKVRKEVLRYREYLTASELKKQKHYIIGYKSRENEIINELLSRLDGECWQLDPDYCEEVYIKSERKNYNGN